MCNFASCRLDTNECAVDSTLCGSGGTCMNNDNGNFYSCDCNDGFEGNGASASDGSLTCVGMFHTIPAHVCTSTLFSKYPYLILSYSYEMISHAQFKITLYTVTGG